MPQSSEENLINLTNKQLTVLKKAIDSSLVNFSEAVDKGYRAGWFHELLANILQQVYSKVIQGEEVRLILEVPPQHGKSELSTIKFPAWVLGKNPEIPIIVSSYGSELAVDFGQKTRDLMNNQNYQQFFSTRLREDTQAKGHWMTDKDGGYTAVGVGGAITGRGFKIGIIDDPFKNKEEAESDLIRQKVWDWWTSTFYTRQRGNTAIIIIMTRWHTDDLVGRLIDQQEEKEKSGETNYDKWKVIRFPAIAEEDEKFRKQGEALWPERFPLYKLETTKNSIGIMDFEALYQQNPLNSLTADFKQEYFKYFEENELPVQMDIDITVDPAISKKKLACNSAIMAIGKSSTLPDWYVLDYKFGKFNPGELIEKTFETYFELSSLYPKSFIRIWVEGVAYQEALKYFFEEEMKKRRVYFYLDTFIDKQDKDQRIKGLIPLYKVGIIKHRKWMTDLEKEALKFPKGRLKDLIDALSFHLHIKRTTDFKEPDNSIKRPLNMGWVSEQNKPDVIEQSYLL